MRLKSIKYIEFEGQPNEWGFDCTWGDINLVVGRNATGKTNLLRIFNLLAQHLSGQVKIAIFENFEVVFEHDQQVIQYFFKIKDGLVVYEKLIEDDKVLLHRSIDNLGQIWAEEFQQMMKFQPPNDMLAVVNRRDALQHPFLQKFYDWGQRTHYFKFNTSMGQGKSASFIQTLILDLNVSEYNVVELFMKGKSKFNDSFINSIKTDMQALYYPIENIVAQPVGIESVEKPYYLFVKEQDLVLDIPQYALSSGMFRALSLLIQINYLLKASQPSCIIIDDIGEGLDFSRSTKLIKLLIEKVQGSQIQLIMSTNDQFVMDAVPLEYWQIIQREGNQLKIYNYHNSKAIFDKFEFTGLGNFDFFTSNYFLRTPPVA